MCGGGGSISNGFGIGDALASIDPGPAIGQGLAEADTFVNREIPGGWALPAAIAAAYATGYIDPSLFASEAAATAGAEAGAGAIASEAGQTAFFEALASGATSSEAVSAGLAADSLALGGAGTGALADSTTGLGSLTDPSLTTQIGAPTTSGGTFGSITAPLEGSGAIPGAGATTLPGGGLTGALPSGTLVGDGTLGTTMGVTYIDAGGGQFALDAFGNPIEATSIGLDGFAPSSSLSLSDLNKARQAYGLAKSLLGAGAATTAGRSAMSAGAGTGAGTGAGLEGTTSAPKGTLVQGKQIASPLASSYNIPTQPVSGGQSNPATDMALIQNAATGGIIHLKSGGDPDDELPMKPAFMRGKQTQHSNLFGLGGIPLFPTISKAEGGSIPANFSPQFYSEGGLGSMKNSHVRGAGTGTSDSIPAMLSDGEFVIPADVVSSLGDGSNDGGAKILDSFLTTIRSHKKKHDAKHLPAQSKSASGYLLEAKRKVKK